MTDTQIPRALAATALAACLAGPALAQSDSASTGSDASTMPMGQRADQVTCAHLSAMDAKAMETTLYYIAGYKRGQTDALDLSGAGGGMETSAAAGGTGTAAPGTASSGTTTAMTQPGSTGTAATGTGGADTTTAMNQGGGGATGALSGGAAPDAATGTTAGSVGAVGGAGMSDGTEIDGFFAIPVAQVTVACIDDPAQSVSDVIDRHRGTMNN